MLQVAQNLRTGDLRVLRLPEPAARAHQVVIANHRSVISAGTEKSAIELARKSLLGKALDRPDQVRRVLEKLRSEGLWGTLQQVSSRLDEDVGLGYSSAGVVLEVGPGVQGLRPGDRVASNGPHAGVVCVPRNLCASVPEGVSFEQAAYAVLGAIALQAVRLSSAGIGDAVLVLGLGPIGQIAVGLLRTAGARVLGADPDPARCELARRMGAEEARPGLGAKDVAERTRGLGADAVLIAASTPSNEPVELAAEAVRTKGRVVALGAVGLGLPRRPFYFKEAELVVSCSYGPGRYDPDYEERGRDYPAGYVRWTEQRNLQAVLDLMASGRLDLSPLTTHRFPIERAEEAYRLIEEGKEPYLGVVLEYPGASERRERRVERQAAPAAGPVGLGVLGAGAFARAVLLPALAKAGPFRPRILCAASGLSAGHAAERHGFEAATTDEDQVFADPETRAVAIATRHALHAGQAAKALRAGKHVFVEKPLALTVEEVATVEAALAEGKAFLMVGFNRRFSPAAIAVRRHFAGVTQPLTASIRFNAGALPPEHWTQEEAEGGGRIIGEACHAIDLATFLTASPPVRVFAECVGGPQSPPTTHDHCFITIRHANGSISSIAYLAGGDRSVSKERVEVMGGGRAGLIEDFRETVLAAGGKSRRQKSWSQNKGHRAEVEAFGRAIVEGRPSPIPWEEIRAVSLASILAVRSLREGVPFDLP